VPSFAAPSFAAPSFASGMPVLQCGMKQSLPLAPSGEHREMTMESQQQFQLHSTAMPVQQQQGEHDASVADGHGLQFPMVAIQQVRNLLSRAQWYGSDEERDPAKPIPLQEVQVLAHPQQYGAIAALGWRPEHSTPQAGRLEDLQLVLRQSAFNSPVPAAWSKRRVPGSARSSASPGDRSARICDDRGLLRPGSTFDLTQGMPPCDKVLSESSFADKLQVTGKSLWSLVEALTAPSGAGFPWCSQAYHVPSTPRRTRSFGHGSSQGCTPSIPGSGRSAQSRLGLGLGNRTWCIRTSPSQVTAAESGGCPSVKTAVLAEGNAERSISAAEVEELMLATGTSVSSFKGNKDSAPNQDRAVCLSLQGVELLGLFDGHGEMGHAVAELCSQVLPKLLLKSLSQAREASSGPRNPQEADGSGAEREAVVTAFLEMHRHLEGLTLRSLSQPPSEVQRGPQSLAAESALLTVDSRVSGTTATVVFVTSQPRLLVAHVGDSRAVVATSRRGEPGPWHVMEATRDHKPCLSGEQSRIEEAGAQVLKKGTELQSIHRVYTPNQTWPSINMSRSLGDLHAHTQGVIATPDVSVVEQPWDSAAEEAVMIIGSDGLWDVVAPSCAVELAVACRDSPEDPAEALCSLAFKRWMAQGLQGRYSDDITVVVKFF